MSPPTGQGPPGSTLDDRPLFIENAVQQHRPGWRLSVWLGGAPQPMGAGRWPALMLTSGRDGGI
jgi:hypothetical protein